MNFVFTQITRRAKYWCDSKTLRVSGDHWETMKYAGKSGQEGVLTLLSQRLAQFWWESYLGSYPKPLPLSLMPASQTDQASLKQTETSTLWKTVVDLIWKSFRSSGHLEENPPFPFDIRKLKGKKGENEEGRRKLFLFQFITFLFL